MNFAQVEFFVLLIFCTYRRQMSPSPILVFIPVRIACQRSIFTYAKLVASCKFTKGVGKKCGNFYSENRMSRIPAIKESLEKALHDESKMWTKYLAKIEKKTGVDRLYVFLGVVGLSALYLVFGIGQQLVCNIFGFMYPAYCSMKALETQKKDDDTKWLTYWVVYAVFTIIEFFSDNILCWFPVYWLFKCLFYIWLMAPMENNGSLVLYRRIIRPNFLRYHRKVDEFISSAQDTVIKAAASALSTEKQE